MAPKSWQAYSASEVYLCGSGENAPSLGPRSFPAEAMNPADSNGAEKLTERLLGSRSVDVCGNSGGLPSSPAGRSNLISMVKSKS